MGRQVEKQYIQTGKVRFGYLHFMILGPESVLADQASECAADQGQFWEYHDSLFENHAGKNKGGFSRDILNRLATEIGLYTIAFDACLDSDPYLSIIQEQTGYASSLGFQSTPAFLINGKPLVGMQTSEDMQKYTVSALIVGGFLIGLCTVPCSGAVYLGVLSLLALQPTRLLGYSYLVLYNFVFILPLVIILILAAARPTLNRLAHWNLHHKEWVRLVLGAGVVAMGLLILATV